MRRLTVARRLVIGGLIAACIGLLAMTIASALLVFSVDPTRMSR